MHLPHLTATLRVDDAPETVVETIVSTAQQAENDRQIVSHTGIVENPGRSEVERILNWRVDRLPLYLGDGSEVKTHVATARHDSENDTHDVLGVVGEGFGVIQNSELLDLADSVRNEHQLKFANAGMSTGGKRVFFQCEGESFDVGDGDSVKPYMLFANGHDGSLSCRMAPMTERLFCQNQLGSIQTRTAGWVTIRHTGDVKTKLAEAGRLGQHYMAVCKADRLSMIELRETAVKTSDLMSFYHGLYSKHYGPVVANPVDAKQERAAERAKEGYSDFLKRFEAEKHIAGATAWNMANAYTGWIQHDKGADSAGSKTRRAESALFGVLADRSVEAFRAALSL